MITIEDIHKALDCLRETRPNRKHCYIIRNDFYDDFLKSISIFSTVIAQDTLSTLFWVPVYNEIPWFLLYQIRNSFKQWMDEIHIVSRTELLIIDKKFIIWEGKL